MRNDQGILPTSREARKWLERECRKWPATMTEIPREQWPHDRGDGERRVKLWRSNRYLAQVFREPHALLVSMNRTVALPNGHWDDGLTWDEIQTIKREIGYGDCFAVEIYPEDREVVNVANMRHIWILPHPITEFGWRKPVPLKIAEEMR